MVVTEPGEHRIPASRAGEGRGISFATAGRGNPAVFAMECAVGSTRVDCGGGGDTELLNHTCE